MKQIQSLPIWDNGQTKEAVILQAYAVNVQLGSTATFYYALMSAEKQTLAQGNLVMDGDAYQAWDDDIVAWDWIASKLNLEIVGDWVDPVIETKEVEVIAEPIAEK